MTHELEIVAVRDRRQRAVMDWAFHCFGSRAMGLKERALRVLEEAIELAQAEGVEPAIVNRLTDHVYSKPPGAPNQEVGGVAVTLLCYCERKRLSLEAEEVREFRRVLALPREHFAARHAAKDAAGIAKMEEP
jgi:hypothetical protein